MRSTTTHPDFRNLSRAGIVLAVWIALVLLMLGSVWELRSGATERQAPPASRDEVNEVSLLARIG